MMFNDRTMDTGSKKVAVVAVQESLDEPLDYLVPLDLRENIEIGHRVVVPLRNRYTTGYVISLKESSEYPKLKEVLQLLDEKPILSGQIIELARWISRYYISPLGLTLKAALPGGINVGSISKVVPATNINKDMALAFVPARATTRRAVLRYILDHQQVDIESLANAFPGKDIFSALRILEKDGLITLKKEISKPLVQPKFQKAVRLNFFIDEIDQVLEEQGKLTPKRREFLLSIARKGGDCLLSDLKDEFGDVYTIAKALEEKGLIVIERERVYRSPLEEPVDDYPKPRQLTESQRSILEQVIDDIEAKRFQVHLVYGVTGSGKTEVYLQAIDKVLQNDMQAIVLVPEISLTPQLVKRFRGRYGDTIAILHSKVSAAERYDQFSKIKRSELNIAIGARSAIFAPFENLGLIVCDEEHDSSYKQDEVPMYHGRDVAVYRGKLASCPVILGSATPSVESFYNTQIGKYRLHRIPKRIDDRPMPKVHIIDMRKHYRRGNIVGEFSMLMIEQITKNLIKGNQTLIFKNKRAFHTSAICQHCGNVLRCPDCSVALKYHQKMQALRCHYCGYKSKMVELCPECGNPLDYRGFGTQRIEQELKELFKGARIVRMDSDAVTRKRSHDVIIKEMETRAIDILVGTQMITKGHDLPGVTLVCVLNADDLLNLPDFRAAERAFQTLTQVAGRAGRGDMAGNVLIQTYSPTHYALQHTKEHDYDAFYANEIVFRERLGYPPFTRMANIVVSHADPRECFGDIIKIRRFLDAGKSADMEILGPAPAPLAKLRGKYRWQMFIKSKQVSSLHNLLGRARAFANKQAIDARFDIDPVDVM